jgi:hypothetical protein
MQHVAAKVVCKALVFIFFYLIQNLRANIVKIPQLFVPLHHEKRELHVL